MLLATTTARNLLLSLTLPLAAQLNVLTYQYDNGRAGANLNEAVLTPGNVNSTQFGKLFSQPVDGVVYGQPLYLEGVNISGNGFHNVVYVATEHDSVYAFDADDNVGTDAAPLWQVSFVNPAKGVTTVPASDVSCDQITPEIGITSTPVIDPASGTIYVVAMTKETSNGTVSYVQRLHALDVTSGAEKPGSPVIVQATVPGTGDGGTTNVFQPKNYKQRPGLLLLGGVVFTAWSSHCDEFQYHGWLIGYDAKTLAQVSLYNNTPNGSEGSFWAGGAAPAADTSGNIFLVAGNGTFDRESGGVDLGESYIKVSVTGGLLPAGLSVEDYFAPFNFDSLNRNDVDVGSSGVAFIGDDAGSTAQPHLMVGVGKEGRIYVLDRDNLGKWQAGSDSQIVASLASAVNGSFGKPAYFNKTVYFCGSGDSLKAFTIANAVLSATPSSKSATAFGYPGCVPTISANGTSNAIVWALDPAGALRAYDAGNLANELYDSNQNRARDALGGEVKFSVPIVVNGKVYAGTQNSVAVYGLLSTIGVRNAASGQANIAAPGSILSIYGSGLAQETATASMFPLAPILGGASVDLEPQNSARRFSAPIYYASSVQVNVQVPFDVPTGAATARVGSADAVTFVMQLTAPGLFLFDGGRAAAINQDGTINGPSQPASVGSVLQVYATGLGAVDHPVATGDATPLLPFSRTLATVDASLGGQSAEVQFAGLAPGFAGLYQVNVVVPQLAPGDYALEIIAGGVTSNAATVSIR
jgi:uncharacterized protein (TIGR03437 family)